MKIVKSLEESGLLIKGACNTVKNEATFYQNEPKFNGVYSRNNLSKIKDETYVINLDEYESIGT